MNSRNPERKISFAIDSDIEAVSLIGLSINRICMHLEFDQTEAYRIELSVVEVITNSIRHAYENSGDYRVDVELEIFPDYLSVTVMDEGIEFDKKHLKRGLKVDPNDPASLPVGGMGIHLILSIMDEVDVQRSKGRNLWILKKFFKKQGDKSEFQK